MNQLRNAVIESVVGLHRWRLASAGEHAGLGLDPYRPGEAHHYPEAYALWGRGYRKLAQLLGDSSYLECSRAAADWLLANTSPAYADPSWGLPWPWERWSAPASLSYLVTSAFCGSFLLHLHASTNTDAYLEAARGIARWMVSSNGGVEGPAGAWLYYANSPGLHLPVVNANAIAAGFLARLWLLAGDDHARQMCEAITLWIIDQQKPDGRWAYRSDREWVDNVHTGYTLEGLLEVRNALGDIAPLGVVGRGLTFYWGSLFREDGKGWEQLPSERTARIGFHPRKWLRDTLADAGAIQRPRLETRLWGYAAAIRAFSMAGAADPRGLERAARVFEFIRLNLRNTDGSYAFRTGQPTAYIRHQAHLFDALVHFGSALPS